LNEVADARHSQVKIFIGSREPLLITIPLLDEAEAVFMVESRICDILSVTRSELFREREAEAGFHSLVMKVVGAPGVEGVDEVDEDQDPMVLNKTLISWQLW
jgi:hypothetical protein